MSFIEEIQASYMFKGQSIDLGKAIYRGVVLPEASISLPLSTLNRHGLIAGATGTGKTKTLQKIIESLSANGIPTIMMDMKGDASGLAMPGEMNQKISERLALMSSNILPSSHPESLSGSSSSRKETEDSGPSPEWQAAWIPQWFPTEFYTLTGTDGVRLRATISEFWPILFARLLELNDTQESVMALIFKYCDDHGLLLIDLSDVKKTLQYLANEGKVEIEREYGMISSSTVGTIMRKIIELEGQWASIFFGEPSFDVQDFLRTDDMGRWYVNIIRLMDMMMRPKLFSTFMLSLLSEIYSIFPEVGDVEKPKLVLIFDEAHLIFDDISPALLSEIEMIIRLIRSKWVGIFFCTQNPIDIPSSILAQLGLKVQHALRAFTAKDRDAIRKASENFPITNYYHIADDLTTLGIGEAFVTTLDERGVPTALVHTMIAPPQSRMDTLTENELQWFLMTSSLVEKYRITIDPESANEILTAKISEKMVQMQERDPPSIMDSTGGKIAKNVGGTLAAALGRTLGKSLGGRTGGTIGAQIARGLLGAIFGGK